MVCSLLTVDITVSEVCGFKVRPALERMCVDIDVDGDTVRYPSTLV